VFLIAVLTHAGAGTGACKPDEFEGVTCGQGEGAVRLIPDTTSPSKRLAIGWRNTAGAPTEEPEEGNTLENVLVRLQDGAVLSKLKGQVWATGKTRANRRDEAAVWSSDSRRLIEFYSTRFDTDVIDLYAIGPDDRVSAPFDILKIVDRATKSRISTSREVQRRYSLSVDASSVKIGKDGRVKMSVLLFIPKGEDEHNYDVTLVISNKGNVPSARLVSVRNAD